MNREQIALNARYNRLARDLEESTIQRLDAALDRAYSDLERDFLRSYPAIAANRDLLATQRRAVLLSDLSNQLQIIRPELAGDYEARFQNLIQGAGRLGADLGGELIRAIAPGSEIRAFAGIPLEAVALQARDASRRLYRYNEDFQSKAGAIIEQSLIQGWGPQRAAGLLRQELGVTKFSAERIARTETLSALNDSAQLRYQQNGVEWVQWLTTRGEVCPFCVSRNGNIYEVGKIRVPAHPFCRCILLPAKREWLEDGLLDEEFTRQYASDRLSDLQAQGLQPNPGLTPFERAAKLTAPPTPIWTPEGGLTAPLPPRTAPAPRPTPQPTPAPTGGFPSTPDGLVEVRQLGGSTGARLVEDPATGRRYVLKRGANPGHLREEFAADQAYRAMGVRVPEARLYETPDGPIKLAEFIEGRPFGTLSGAEWQAARLQLQQDFAVDALLGNWDVIGLDGDNVLVDAAGQVWRIDNGGSLRYRAMGTPKGDRWNDYPTELFTLRNPQINLQTADAFDRLTHSELVAQIEAIASKRQTLLNALPQELRESVGRRLDEAERVARISRTLGSDRFNEGYQATFARHSLNLRARGIVDRLPDELQLDRVSGSSIVYDTEGRPWDHLRGRRSILNQFADYVEEDGGRFEQISDWAEAQLRSSWNGQPQAIKALIAEARDSWDDHFWLKGVDLAREQLQIMRGMYPNMDSTFIAYHAFNYEMLQKIQMPGNNRADGTFRVIRTEGKGILRRYGIRRGPGQYMLRGSAESGSFFTAVEAVAGEEITIQTVPHHRIIGSYLHSRYRDGTQPTFMNDRENELLFIPDGIEFEYLGAIGPKVSATANQPVNFTGAKPPPAPLPSIDDDDDDFASLFELIE